MHPERARPTARTGTSASRRRSASGTSRPATAATNGKDALEQRRRHAVGHRRGLQPVQAHRAVRARGRRSTTTIGAQFVVSTQSSALEPGQQFDRLPARHSPLASDRVAAARQLVASMQRPPSGGLFGRQSALAMPFSEDSLRPLSAYRQVFVNNPGDSCNEKIRSRSCRARRIRRRGFGAVLGDHVRRGRRERPVGGQR